MPLILFLQFNFYFNNFIIHENSTDSYLGMSFFMVTNAYIPPCRSKYSKTSIINSEIAPGLVLFKSTNFLGARDLCSITELLGLLVYPDITFCLLFRISKAGKIVGKWGTKASAILSLLLASRKISCKVFVQISSSRVLRLSLIG